MRSILQGKTGSYCLLIGNEAIARGAIESGIATATTYPGTPASEIGDALARVAPEVGFHFEYSTNEKVALEVATGASLAGLRAITSMKHVGVNVAADALLSLPYIGTVGGLVLVSADDPSCHSSQNEQDNRFYPRFAGLPMLEPSGPQECLEMTRNAFELSEKLSLPVMLRTTTSVSHTTGNVRLGEIRRNERSGAFDRSREFKLLPEIARKKHAELLQKLKGAEELSEASSFNREISVDGSSGFGIIASSAGFNYAIDACQDLGLSASILKIGFSHPLPRRKILSFLRANERVLIVEELEPIMETEIRALANIHEVDIEIFGKSTDHFSRLYEYGPDIVEKSMARAFLKKEPYRVRESLIELPPRPPVMCPGCPHSATYYAVKLATNSKEAIFSSDIGCYSLGAVSPYNMGDSMLCMGASIGIGEGLSKNMRDPVIGFIGDSTFYHSGLPALLNAVHNGHHLMLIVMDNKTTAMTGHQPHPGSDVNAYGESAPAIDLERLLEGMGIDRVSVIDPYDVKRAAGIIREELEIGELSVIISRRGCALLEMAERGKILGKRRGIDQDKCRKCGTCVDGLGCPAIYRQDNVYEISNILCIGCGVCDNVCPHGAIGGKK